MCAFGKNKNITYLDPAHHLDLDPAHHLDLDPAHHLDLDPAHHLDLDPAHHLDLDPAHHLNLDPAHHLVFLRLCHCSSLHFRTLLLLAFPDISGPLHGFSTQNVEVSSGWGWKREECNWERAAGRRAAGRRAAGRGRELGGGSCEEGSWEAY